MANTFLYCSLAFLLLCHASLAQFELGEGRMSSGPFESQGRRLGSRSQCRIERLIAQEPRQHVDAEAGFIEYFDENNEELDCAGVSVFRRTVQPGGLSLPSFSNSPILAYVVQGRGIFGIVILGCPETFQSLRQQSDGRQEGQAGQRFKDQHQKIHRFREGDVIAIPAGVSHWCHNDGESPVVVVNVMDTRNHANQLHRHGREFLLAGQSQRERMGRSILAGFDARMLAEAIGVRVELVEKIQSREDNRGNIVRVKGGELQVLRPSGTGRESEEEHEYGERDDESSTNGLEQAVCSMRLKENIRDPARADVYNPDAGRIKDLNSQKLPILRFLRLSAEFGSLRRFHIRRSVGTKMFYSSNSFTKETLLRRKLEEQQNAIYVLKNGNAIRPPHWNVNDHSVEYVLRGSCRCQVVDNRGRAVFDGELRQGQLLVVPQNFALLCQSRSDDFEWVSIKTNDNAIVNQIVGRGSALKSMPADVLVNSYRISREEARMVKERRGQEVGVFSPRFQGRDGDEA